MSMVWYGVVGFLIAPESPVILVTHSRNAQRAACLYIYNANVIGILVDTRQSFKALLRFALNVEAIATHYQPAIMITGKISACSEKLTLLLTHNS